MGFSEAVRTVFGKYIAFDGRAGRSEYWYWVLFVVIVSIVLSIVDSMFGLMVGTSGILSTLFGLATVVPSVAVAIRRMHDVGKSGWFVLIPLYNLYLAIQPSDGPNAYGSAPAPAAAATA